MAADDFFARWSKKKTEGAAELPASTTLPAAPADATSAPLPAAEQADRPLPTHADVEKLTHDSDFSAFMARGVDEDVKRSAMKKLFSNPHFNVMDGLDIYIDDYNAFEALTPDILHALNHAKALLDPSSQFEPGLMQLLKNDPLPTEENRVTELPVPETQDDQSLPVADAGTDIVKEEESTDDSLSVKVRNEDAHGTDLDKLR